MKKKLTDRIVKALKPPQEGKDQYWDKDAELGLNVYSSGKKSWIVMYRVGGKQKSKKLGVYPTMKMAEAKREARDILNSAQKGLDLVYERKKTKRLDGKTFKAISNEYLEKHAKPKKRQWKADERLIKKELLPAWGRLRATDIKKRDVIALLDGVVSRGAPIQANRIHSLISVIFNWAISRDMLEVNPCHGIKKLSKENERERVLTEEEIRSVWIAFDEQGAHVGAIFKLMLLLAQRRWEISHMRFRDIDEKGKWWTIPGEFVKNGHFHRVPLCVTAKEIISSLPEKKKDQVWVFPSPTRENQHIANVQKAAQRVKELSGIQDFWLHDLRRTATSHMASAGIPGPVLSKVLNHVEAGVTRLYDRYSYDLEKMNALETWENKLLTILDPIHAPKTNEEAWAFWLKNGVRIMENYAKEMQDGKYQ